MKKSAPLITVFMPVFNTGAFLREAIESILAQTFSDFELLIIDDGSTDNSKEVLQSFSDPRIIVYQHQRHEGLGHTRNEGLQRARGEYIAFMDSDDTSAPQRLEHQIQYLKTHPDIGAVGTWLERFSVGKRQVLRTPLLHNEIAATMLFRMSLNHATLMFRRNLIKQHNLRYPTDAPTAEDYEFCAMAISSMIFSTIPEVLYFWRTRPQSASNANAAVQEKPFRLRIYALQIQRLKLPTDENYLLQHDDIARFRGQKNLSWLKTVNGWLTRIMGANAQQRVYDPKALRRTLAFYFTLHCAHIARRGYISVIFLYMKSPWRFKYFPDSRSIAALLQKFCRVS